MNFWLVVIMGLTGSLLSQVIFYFLGRWRGQAVIKRFPKLRSGYPKARALVQRFGSTGILIVQDLYGMRLVTSFALGTLQIKTLSFILWLLLATSLWALGVASAGYTMGVAIHYLISRMQIFLTVTVTVIVAFILAYRWFWKWTERQVRHCTVPEPVCQNFETFQLKRPPIDHRH